MIASMGPKLSMLYLENLYGMQARPLGRELTAECCRLEGMGCSWSEVIPHGHLCRRIQRRVSTKYVVDKQ